MSDAQNYPYEPPASVTSDLDVRFRYHAPRADQVPRYELIRAKAREFAEVLVRACPTSRELSTALPHLDTAVFHANASIARNETAVPPTA